MDKKLVFFLLGIICALTLSLRLYFAFETEFFTGDQAYFTLRQVEYIRQHWVPMYDDPLSYGGRHYVFLPFFHYVLALFSLFMPVQLACKIMPNIFAVSTVLIVYLITFFMTKNERSALLSAFISAFIPVFFSRTINTISVYSLSVPLTLLLIYAMMRINIKKNPNYFIIAFAVLLLLHQSVYLILAGLLIYLILLAAENIDIGKSEAEITIFSVFLTLWLYLIIYKEAFLMHGYRIIWQNLPASLLDVYFADINILEAIYLIGIMPVVAGMITIFIYIFRRKKKPVYLLTAFAFSVGLLLWLKMVGLDTGLIYLGIILSVLFGEFLQVFFNYMERSRISKYKGMFYIFFLMVFVITSMPASLIYAQTDVERTITVPEVLAIKNLGQMSQKGDVVVATPEEGHYIAYFAGRKTVMDTNFLEAQDVEQRLRDSKVIFTSALARPDLLEKYNIKWIYFSENAEKYYNVSRISYIDKECFDTRYNSTHAALFESTCRLMVPE
jgi:hypothetical protein